MSRRFDQARRRPLFAVAATAVLLAASACATPAFASAAPAPYWRLESRAVPTNLPLHGEGEIFVDAVNLGGGTVDVAANPVEVTDTLPAGLEVAGRCVKVTTPGTGGYEDAGCTKPSAAHTGEYNWEAEAELVHHPLNGLPGGLLGSCSDSPGDPTVACTIGGGGNSAEDLLAYEALELVLHVRVSLAGASAPVNEVTVGGGDTPPASLSSPLRVNGEPTPFGVERYELTPENEDGSPDTQAGSHPFQLTTTFNLNETREFGEPWAPALERNLSFELPPGLIGDANVNTAEDNPVGQCPDGELSGKECPGDTAVGIVVVTFNDPAAPVFFATRTVPLFNLVPAPGEPARFGFESPAGPVILDTSVRTGEGYGVTVSVHNTTEAAQVLGSMVTFWGVPGAPVHDDARGWECLGGGSWLPPLPVRPCAPKDPAQPEPFLTLPTSCGSLASTVEGEAWDTSPLVGPLGERSIAGESPTTLTGCKELPFEPSVAVKPDAHRASTPTGLTVEVNVPQGPTLTAGENAEAGVRSTTVEFPEGVQASPGAADGLETCSVGQAGFGGLDGDTGSVLGGELEGQRFTDADVTCPEAAKIGTVAIKTPLLAEDLRGSVYMAGQDTNPFASPLVLYLVAEEPVSKVLVKLAGEVTLNPVTGQLVSTFRNTPPLPFENLTLHLFNTERSSQSTPPLCGTYTTQASLEPWSSGPAKSAPSTFQITEGANGGPCETSFPQSFAPSFQAGSTNSQAAGFTPFTLTIEHSDADQSLSGVTMHLPPGIAALLSKVTPCGEPAAGQPWNCGPESLIGHSSTSSGLGGDPYTLAGDVYLTSGYDGAPFGLLVATEAKAGPFNLGMVYVRSRINVNPETAAVSITTDPGPHGDVFPTILKGVPVQLKQLNVTVNRPEFQFNPTSCAATAVTGTLAGAQGGSEAVSSPFRATGCASLPFKPKLTASTGGHGSKARGTSLDVKIVSAGLGQANIHKVDLTLPKALPSRLTTLQKACLEAVFDVNPAGCGAGSVIGTATVHTPVLKSPLTGPAYLVSHGGAAFPDVEFVLQGEGITLIVDGKTDIKDGITYSKFETAPDAPFTSFETVLPAGPHSILGAYVKKTPYDLCGTNLQMPTEITGQNGAELHQDTRIEPEGCPNSISVLSHSVNKRTLTLYVYAPAAGKLTASGKGISSGSKTYSGREALTFTLNQKKARKLATKIKLTFTPSKGTKQVKTVKADFKH
jgi:hypothetical protein